MKTDYDSRSLLLSAALDLLGSDLFRSTRLSGPNDDAEAELNDERLLIAARLFVKAHEGQEVVGV